MIRGRQGVSRGGLGMAGITEVETTRASQTCNTLQLRELHTRKPLDTQRSHRFLSSLHVQLSYANYGKKSTGERSKAGIVSCMGTTNM